MLGILKENKDGTVMVLDTDDFTIETVQKSVVSCYRRTYPDVVVDDLSSYLVRRYGDHIVVYVVDGIMPNFMVHFMVGVEGKGLVTHDNVQVTGEIVTVAIINNSVMLMGVGKNEGKILGVLYEL